MGCIAVVIFLIIIGVLVASNLGESVNSGNNTVNNTVNNTATSNTSLDEDLVKKIVFFLKIGFGVIRTSFEGGLLSVKFSADHIYIYFWDGEGIEEIDGFIRGCRDTQSNDFNYNSHLGEFGFTIGEYKNWKRHIEGMEKSTRIQITKGLNNRYYERVKREIEKIYSESELKKIRFSDPTSSKYGEIRFDYNREKANE